VTPLADTDIQRILVVTAHPDDLDFGAAGTIAGWTAAGIAVSYCIATYGDAGGFDPAVPRSEIPRIREAEQRAAGAALGVDDITFLGHPDGRVEVTQDLRRDISRQIRRVRPQRVVTQSPLRNWDRIGASHPDHMHTGEAALCAVYPDARNPYAHPELLLGEQLEAWSVSEVWLQGGPNNSHYVDITDTFDRKLAALLEHKSQTAHMDDLEGLLRTWTSANALAAGLPGGRLAEAYQIVKTA